MRSLVAVVAVLSVALAAPPPPAQIVSLDSEVLPDGSYKYSYEGTDGSKASESGSLRYVDDKHAGEVAEGSYEFIGDDGKTYKVSYIADENGFRAVGDHIPQIPPAISAALEWAAAHPYTEKGSA